jgi:hypothetical protein
MLPTDKCARCGHDRRDHCRPGTSHGSYKEEARMVPLEWRRHNVTCITAHRLQPLCSCVDFVDEVK